MRVTGGILRGRRLLGAGGAGVRPTQDRVRESLFSILGETVRGRQVADLFAGTGSLGIEALSRGAHHAVFVEEARPALRALEENLSQLGLGERAEVVASRVEGFLEEAGPSSYDLVLVDPPYEEGSAGSTLALVAARAMLTPRGLIALECRRSEPELSAPAGMELVLRRAVGDTRLEIFRPGTVSQPESAGGGVPPGQGGRW